jgi:hypothetical protein
MTGFAFFKLALQETEKPVSIGVSNSDILQAKKTMFAPFLLH